MDYRQYIYFVDSAKKLHNVRRIESFNMQLALRGNADTVNTFAEKDLTD